MDRSKHVAKWGAACAACASAKAKCLRSNDNPGSKCDRCERLFKECTGQVHRPRKKRTARPSRTDQLEEKLNGLVDLLRASGDIPALNRPEGLTLDDAVSIDAACACLPSDQYYCDAQDLAVPSTITNKTQEDPETGVQSGPSPSRDDDDGYSSISEATELGASHIPSSYNAFAPASCICRASPARPLSQPPIMEADDVLLTRYQNQMCQNYPFVIIPPGATPASLRENRPFTWSAIKMAASINSMHSMQYQMYRIMKRISENMLIRSERSLDLLLGIVVVLGWYHHHCMSHAQMSNLRYLARSLIGDLYLDRSPLVQEKTKLLVLNPAEPTPRTNEERRALLGVWYLCSSVFVGLRCHESMRYTKYIQQCIKELEDGKEFESDIVLVYMVRIQHLTEDIYNMNTEEADDEPSGIPRAPKAAYQSAFQAELDRFRSGMTKALKANKFLMLHLHTAALHLYEPPIITEALLGKFSAALASPSSASLPSVLDMFYQSNGALRSFFEHWLSIPIAQYQFLSDTNVAQLIYSITMLNRWSKVTGPQRPSLAPPAQVSGLVDPAHRPTGTREQRALPKSPSKFSSSAPQSVAPAAGSSQSPSCSSAPGTCPPSGDATCLPGVNPLSAMKVGHRGESGLPRAAAMLRAQLRSQPELSLDIPAVLVAIGARFEQADRDLAESSDGQGGNFWDLSAKKVMIARAKLERWAEIVEQQARRDAGEESDDEEDEEDEGQGMQGVWEGGAQQIPSQMPGPQPQDFNPAQQEPVQTQPQPHLQHNHLGDVVYMQPGWQQYGGNMWGGGELFDGLERGPDGWFDIPTDWNAMAMPQLGPTDQLGGLPPGSMPPYGSGP